jgi:hypothetical protein
MQNVVFHRLCSHLRSRGLLEDSIFVSIEEQVAMFMHFVGQRWTNRNVSFEFMRSGETVSRYFHSVLDAICVLSSDLITSRFTETHLYAYRSLHLRLAIANDLSLAIGSQG